MISIHTSAREVTAVQTALLIWLKIFQSTLPQGKWRIKWVASVCFVDFNPHFRKGSDGGIVETFASLGISIHTSAREVTEADNQRRKGQNISIHTSAREVTVPALASLYESYDFNPHFRKGSDWEVCNMIEILDEFQSTLPQGKWQVQILTLSVLFIFQSTLPQGKWHRIWKLVSHYDNFNPHFRKGSDES